MSPGNSAIDSLIRATKPLRVVLLTNPWYECLEDTARLLALGLGCPSIIKIDPNFYFINRGKRDVILGLHASPEISIPSDSIIYQTEHPSTWTQQYCWEMGKHEVWTYSAHARPGPDSKHVPLGYHPDFPRIAPAKEQDIDVLFFGSLSDRRVSVLNEMTIRHGLRVHAAPLGTFGPELHSLISRSKVVLNVHYYTEPACFEFARVVHLVHSRVCVLSEESEGGEGLGLAATCPYDRISESAEFLVQNSVARKLAARAAFKSLQSRPMSDILKGALVAPGEVR